MKNRKFWNWINQADESAPAERVLELYGTIAELGFADGILTDEKHSTDAEGYAFSASAVERALINKISGRNKPEPKPAGRSVQELKAELYKKLL